MEMVNHMDQKKILIVEDEPDVIEFIRDILTDKGYTVEAATDGNEGLEKISAFNPDLILLDIQMPNETGIGMYRRMLREDEKKDIPVMVVSGMPGMNWTFNAKIPVVDKPIDEKKLVSQIERLLN